MFRDIKVGDVVIAHKWNNYASIKHKYILCEVTKVNKKTFKVDKFPYKTFMIDDGSVYGDKGWEQMYLMKYDEEFYKQKTLEESQAELRNNLLIKVKTFKVVEGNEVE